MCRLRRVIWIATVVLCAAGVLDATNTPQQGPSESETEGPSGFGWGPALQQSFYFLSIEHSLRMTQAKTSREFQGRFLKDYWTCIKSIKGWGDGDGVFTNYVAHPMQGGVAGFIQIQNDPGGATRELSRSGAYWRSRFKALAWSAAYSTQFEIGPISEATIGHVGKRPGTAGYTDLVMTPVGGLGMIVLEDALDSLVLKRLEMNGARPNVQRVLRMALNPQRSLANLLRLKRPWHRDSRGLNLYGRRAANR
jgi:hypothetical protein